MTLREQQTGLGETANAPTKKRATASPPVAPRARPTGTQAVLPVKQVPAGGIDLLNQRSPVRHTTAQASIPEDEIDYDDAWPGRLPSSARRYSLPPTTQPKPLPPGQYTINGRKVIVGTPQVIRRRAHALPPYEDEEEAGRPRTTRRLRADWRLILGLGMIIMLGLGVAGYTAWTWWNMHQLDVTFGRPRTFQFDAMLPGNSAQFPTHFICLNLNRHVEVYEEPGGDASKTIVYNGPVLFGDGEDLTPVLGRVAPIQGQIALILYIQDQTLVYFYAGGKFVPATQQQVATIHQLPPPPTP